MGMGTGERTAFRAFHGEGGHEADGYYFGTLSVKLSVRGYCDICIPG